MSSITNKQLAIDRSRLMKEVREFFDKQDFIEVETPIMNAIPGMEPHLMPFETELITAHGERQAMYLNTSPELQMKKLLGKGFEKIYNITKVFRNGETHSNSHVFEFTMLEWYRQEANYLDLMEDCENLVRALAGPKEEIEYQGQVIKLETRWPRLSVNELFIEYCGLDLEKLRDYNALAQAAESRGLNINHCQDWDHIFFKLFLNEIEPKIRTLNTPVFIYDYPISQAALAKKSDKNPFFAERFELYIAGLELANAFSELLDPQEQKARLFEEQALRKQLQKTVFPIDQEFLNALSQIQHPTAGIALGLDRLFMLLLDKSRIQDVLLFAN